jgi:hypothetical protein
MAVYNDSITTRWGTTASGGPLNAKSRVLLTEPGPDLREDFDLLLDGLEAQVA